MSDLVFRAIEAFLWAMVLASTIRSVLRLLFGSPRSLDVIWAMVFFGTTNRLLFNAILIWLPGSAAARDVAHLMAMLVAATVLMVRWSKAGEA